MNLLWRAAGVRFRLLNAAVLSLTAGIGVFCYGADDDNSTLKDGSFVVMTFNTGTTPRLAHDDPPDDGYTTKHAQISDAWYGNGLAWNAAIRATRIFIEKTDADIIAFQELFYPEDCPAIPAEARTGFICQSWKPGDPSVARMILSQHYQIAYHPGKPNKCVAVHERFGTIRGYNGDGSLTWLEGHPLKDCGSGSRVARMIVDRANGETLTVVSIHGTSGARAADQQCRVRQFEQIFVDFGDGAPAANGKQNLILGDFNTDPGRAVSIDQSAKRLRDFVGEGKAFRFLSRVGDEAPRSYQRFADIDHIVSDVFTGRCRYPGVDGEPAVFQGRYFDHVPVVCTVSK